MIFFTSSSLHLIVCQQLQLSKCAVCQSMLSCPKQKRHRFTMFMSRKFGSRSNRLAGYKGHLLEWNQLGNNKMSLQTDPQQTNLKLFIQYQNTMLNLQLYHFSYVIMYDNYVIRRLHIIKLQPYLLSTVENIFQSWPLIGWDAYYSSSAIYHYCEIVTIFLTRPN